MTHGAPDHRLVIDLVELVKLINKIDEITKISEITDLKNIDSVDLVDRITRIDSIYSLGEIAIGRVLPLIAPPLLLLDQFDSSLLKWTPLGDGRLELSSKRAFSGSGSMRIYAGPSTSVYQHAFRQIAVSADLTMRLVTRFSLSSTGMVVFGVGLIRYTGSQQLFGEVRYLVVDKKWQYRTGDATWVDIPGGAQDIKLDLDTWHHLTLECDFSTKKFVHLKVDALTMDMSDIDIWAVPDDRSEYAQVFIATDAGYGQITEAYVDDVYVEAW